jgi:hypothetical protein
MPQRTQRARVAAQKERAELEDIDIRSQIIGSSEKQKAFNRKAAKRTRKWRKERPKDIRNGELRVLSPPNAKLNLRGHRRHRYTGTRSQGQMGIGC